MVTFPTVNPIKIVTTITFGIMVSIKDFLVRVKYFPELKLLVGFYFFLEVITSASCVPSLQVFRAQFATLLPAFASFRPEATGVS